MTTEYILRGGDNAEIVSVDEIVGHNLGLTAISPSVAVVRARNLKDLSLDELRELDDARDLIRSCLELVDRVKNVKVAQELALWSEVWGDLN
ncbi:hypothetical protein ACI2K4_24285 [Micromonospora sp. NPDC050397]|uniref:hypothetical protein n=1 Tax=Micromonospora sp. NPDC050397 TaxID=3364279 RepID=UPI003850B86B